MATTAGRSGCKVLILALPVAVAGVWRLLDVFGVQVPAWPLLLACAALALDFLSDGEPGDGDSPSGGHGPDPPPARGK
jgi:hypothetical protein